MQRRRELAAPARGLEAVDSGQEGDGSAAVVSHALRIRTRGRYNPRPGFLAITHALLRRLHLLAAVHAGGPADSGWMRPLLEAADRVRTRRAEWTLYRWSRPSGRQQAEIPMDGLLGEVEAEGELGPLLPYLEAGQWLQVGSGTSAGLGAYELTAAG